MKRLAGSRDEVLGFLRRKWLEGKPIVPLLGAGISVGSAIPVTAYLEDYLIRVKCLSEIEGWEYSGSEYLRFRGWPSRHQLNIDLLARTAGSGDLTDRLQRAKRHLVAEALKAEIGPRAPTVIELLSKLENARDRLTHARPQWNALLQVMTDRRQSLIDSFFDRLVRDRHPSAAHRFLACLTKLVGWNLILTTNFDDLVETALRDEGLAPVVYELVSNGAMPDPRLVDDHLAVMKMNGGAYGLRAGFELDEPLDPQSVAFFHSYLPRDVILLVLGYSGSERRVTTILESLAEEFDEQQRIIWVNPSLEGPRDPSRHLSRAIWHLEHSDAGLFMQELYEKLTFSHAVGTQPYDALHRLPDVASDRTEEEPRKSSFARNERENTFRADLLRKYRKPDADGESVSAGVTSPCERIWFNLYEVPSLATFLDLLFEEIRRRDRSLPPVILSPAMDFKHVSEQSDSEQAPQRLRWYQFLATALRRSRYLIAIDAVRAFSNNHPAALLAVETKEKRKALFESIEGVAKVRREDLVVFLKELGAFLDAHPLGGSQILVALDDPPDTLEDSKAIKYVRPSPLPSAPAAHDYAKELAKLEALGPVHVMLAAVAVSFRRPRSRVALVRLTAKKLGKVRDGRPEERQEADRDLDRVVGEWAALYSEIEMAIEDLCQAGFFVDQDGGSYCMDSDLRNKLFDQFAARDLALMKDLQSLIADYYRVDVYQQSQDLTAYLEYVFHRLASTALTGPAPQIKTPETWLIASLGREGGLLTGRGYASAVFASFHDFAARCEIVAQRDSREWVIERLDELTVAIWQDLANYEELIQHHLAVATAELDAIDQSRARPEIAQRITLAEAMMDLASYTNRQHFDQPHERTHRRELSGLVSRIRRTLQINGKTEHAPEDIPRSIAETALAVVDQCRPKDWPFWNPSAPEAVEGLWRLEVRCLRALIDYWTREVNPREISRGQTSVVLDQKWPMMATCFDRGIDVLRAEGHGERGLAAQSRLRCAKARALYLRGKFGHADQELNRAHAFAARAQGREAPIAQAIYWLHRAEGCIVHGLATAEKDPARPKRTSLFNTAEIALAHAEELLLPARRDVFWSCRLFLLKAWLEAERLRLIVSRGLKPRLQDPERVAAEATLMSALHALAAGLANIHENQRRLRRVDDLWSALEDLHRRLSAGMSKEARERSWHQLNVRSGLDFYYERRRPPKHPPLKIATAIMGALGPERKIRVPPVRGPKPKASQTTPAARARGRSSKETRHRN